jgi:hypothetical protein
MREVNMGRGLLFMALMSFAPMTAYADNLGPAQAAGNIGETTTVCGVVSSVVFSAVLVGHPTFLNFGATYPNQDLTVFIWGNQRQDVGQKVGSPEALAGHRVCVTGSISGFQGRPQMFLQDASQIKKLKD